MIEVDFPTRGPGYLDISRADDALRHAVKLYLIDNITLYEDGAALPPPRIAYARVSLASDRSFTSYEQARAHVEEPPLADNLDLYWNQQLLDVLLEYQIRSDRSAFSIRPRVDRFGQSVSTALRFLPPTGVTRAFEFHGDPGLVPLDPRWHQAALRFVEFGLLAHPRRLRSPALPSLPGHPAPAPPAADSHRHLVHRRALHLAPVLGFRLRADALWFPPLIETLIAVSIVYMALENIVYAAMGTLTGDLRGAGSSHSRSGSCMASASHLLSANRCNLPATTW